MTVEQGRHALKISARFQTDMIDKYQRGVREHGGNIWEKTELELLDEAISETIDQYVYLSTLRDKIKERLLIEKQILNSQSNSNHRGT